MSSVGRAWEDIKREGQRAINDIANSYQDILIRGHLMPNREISRDISEAEFQKEALDVDKWLDKDEYNQYLDDTGKDYPDPEPGDL